MAAPGKLYARFVRRKIRSGRVYPHYPFEGEAGEDAAVQKALERMNELLARPVQALNPEIEERVFKEIPGLLARQKTG